MGYCPGLHYEAAQAAFEQQRRNYAAVAAANMFNNAQMCEPTLTAKCVYCSSTYAYEHPYKCHNCGAPAK